MIVPFRLFGSMNLSLFDIFCVTTCLSVKVTISPSVLSLLRSVKTALANVDSNKRTPWPLIIKLTEGVVFLNRSDLGAISTLRGIFIIISFCQKTKKVKFSETSVNWCYGLRFREIIERLKDTAGSHRFKFGII